MLTTKTIAIEYTQKEMGKEFKQFPTEKSTKHTTVMHEMSNKKGIGI